MKKHLYFPVLFFWSISYFCSVKLYAADDFFWLARLTPEMRLNLRALVRIRVTGGATNAPQTTATCFYLGGRGNSESDSCSLANPPCSIQALMGLNWHQAPQQTVTISNDGDGSGSIAQSFHNFPTIEASNPQMNTPWVTAWLIQSLAQVAKKLMQHKSPFTAALSGIEYSGASPAQNLIRAPLMQSLPEITGSPLALSTAVSAALPVTNNPGALQEYQSTSASLLSVLGQVPMGPAGHTFFMPALASYVHFPCSMHYLDILVPHRVMVREGFIPGARQSDPKHMNPDRWDGDFEKKE